MRHKNRFKRPKLLEYPEHFRPGMGTETVAPFLRSMVQMIRPNRILEIGAGYSTPFLLEGLVNNQHVIDDGNLNEEYFDQYVYEPKLVIIDDMSQGDIRKRSGMNAILDSDYVEFVEGVFQGKGKSLSEKYNYFDFVWFDCGGAEEYKAFIEEYWAMCTGYVIFHFTYTNGKKNTIFNAISSTIANYKLRLDIVEPHKKRQGSITIVNKSKS